MKTCLVTLRVTYNIEVVVSGDEGASDRALDVFAEDPLAFSASSPEVLQVIEVVPQEQQREANAL